MAQTGMGVFTGEQIGSFILRMGGTVTVSSVRIVIIGGGSRHMTAGACLWNACLVYGKRKVQWQCLWLRCGDHAHHGAVSLSALCLFKPCHVFLDDVWVSCSGGHMKNPSLT